MRLRDLRAVVIGEAGAWLALALLAVAALTAFVAAAGPREIAASNTSAARVALAAVPAQDATIQVSADWYPQPGRPATLMTLSQQGRFGSIVASQFPTRVSSPAADRRAYLAGPLLQPPVYAPSAMVGARAPPRLQLSYDSGLLADATLVSGHWPGAASRGVPGRTAADRSATVLPVVMTQANAARFSLHAGSLQELPALAGRAVWVRVTGIIEPRPGALFWGSTDALPTPSQPSGNQVDWIGGMVVGPAGLVAMQSLEPNGQMQGEWYFPVTIGHLHWQQVGPLSQAVNSLASSAMAGSAASAIGFRFSTPPSISSQLQPQLTTIQSQLGASNGIDSLVVFGLFAAGLLLMLLCAGLAADRFEPELALMRARGASLRQVALRSLARTCATAGVGLVLGIWLAVLVVPTASTSATGWVLPAATVIFAIGIVPVRCAWRVRRGDSARASRRADLSLPGRSPRRIVAEAAVLVLTVAAVVALRTRGLHSTDALAIASPVLIAIAASIAVGRLYPLPVRALTPLAAGRRGPVGFLSLARAGRAGLGATLLPALALVLTMTLVAFGWMLDQSVTNGQTASSWSQSGADVVVTAGGNNIITASAQRAFAAVPGIRRTTRVYTTGATSPFAPSMISPSGTATPVGLAVVDPGQYAALARGTPWPQFPAGDLARRGGPVPILMSPDTASMRGIDGTLGVRQILELDGIRLPVVVTGYLSDTPAFPAGGSYVMMPMWALGKFPSIPGPTTLLATGPHASVGSLTALARREVPGGTYTFRASLLRAQRASAAEYAVRVFTMASWAAAAFSVVALFFGLAASAQSRRGIRSRMAGLGMSSRQARALVLIDPVSLLAVAIAGMVIAGLTLSLISRQVVNLAALTSSPNPAPVSLDAPALVIPAVLAIVVALVTVTAEHWRATRVAEATALRYEEAT